MGVWYATREEVKSSLEVSNSAYVDNIIDGKIEAASRAVEGLLKRRFYPEDRTISVDWPNYSLAPTWEIWLDSNTLISLTSVEAGGESIPTANVLLRRGDDVAEPPYTSIEVSLASTSSFRSGTTFQQAIEITGTFGYNATDTANVDGELGANINASVRTVVINPVSNVLNVGVGSLILIGTERLIVTGRSMLDTTETLTGAVEDRQSVVTLPVSDGTVFAQYETVLIDAERMRIVDIAGNNLIVRRAWDGTVLADHSIGASVYALRTFHVKRGQLGSTAASHTAGDDVSAHRYIGIVNELCIAETIVLLEQSAAGYARIAGSGDNARESSGAGLADVRRRAIEAVGRVSRSGAI